MAKEWEIHPLEEKRLSKVTKGRPALPATALKNLAPLSEEERAKLGVTDGEVRRGKQGSPELAALLTVDPLKYSDEQYYKVRANKLWEKSREEIKALVGDERQKQENGYS